MILLRRYYHWLPLIRFMLFLTLMLGETSTRRLAHWWLTDVYSRRVIRVKVGELLLEAGTLELLHHVRWESLPSVLPKLSQCVPVDFVELPAASFHEPYLKLGVAGERTEEGLSDSRPVISSEYRLVEFLLEGESVGDVEGLEV